MSDGEIGWAAVVLVVRREDRKILCVTNKRYGGWGLPGGKIEEGESARECAARELSEETGVVAEDLELVCATISDTPEPTMRVFCYWAGTARGTPTNVEEGTEVGWMSMEELIGCSPFADFYRKTVAAFFRSEAGDYTPEPTRLVIA